MLRVGSRNELAKSDSLIRRFDGTHRAGASPCPNKDRLEQVSHGSRVRRLVDVVGNRSIDDVSDTVNGF
jgi:hypothetical protein